MSPVPAHAASARPQFLRAGWPAPPGVRAVVSMRLGGHSRGSYAGLNLGSHVGDDPAAVAANRAALAAALSLPGTPLWLRQVHGTRVVVHDGVAPADPPQADASVTRVRGAVLAVLTADCLPVVLATRDGGGIGVAHAGWRGLAGGVLGATVSALAVPPAQLIAWLGPAIETAAFEVGAEVRAAFVGRDAAAEACFHPNARGRWQADLAALARQDLARLGVTDVYGCGEGTYAGSQRWYSHRRDPAAGRMATLAWLAAEPAG